MGGISKVNIVLIITAVVINAIAAASQSICEDIYSYSKTFIKSQLMQRELIYIIYTDIKGMSSNV